MYLTFGNSQLMTDCLKARIQGLTDAENGALHRLLADLEVAENIAGMPLGIRHNESNESRIVFTISTSLDLIGRVDHVVKKSTFSTTWALRDRLLITGFERVGEA